MQYTFPIFVGSLDQRILAYTPVQIIDSIHHTDYMKQLINNKMWFDKLTSYYHTIVSILYQEEIDYKSDCKLIDPTNLIVSLGCLNLGEHTYSYLINNGPIDMKTAFSIISASTNTDVIKKLITDIYVRMEYWNDSYDLYGFDMDMAKCIIKQLDHYNIVHVIYNTIKDISGSEVIDILEYALVGAINKDSITNVQIILDIIPLSEQEDIIVNPSLNIKINSISMVDYLINKFYKIKDEIAKNAYIYSAMVGNIELIKHIECTYNINNSMVLDKKGKPTIIYHVDTLRMLVEDNIITKDNVLIYLYHLLKKNNKYVSYKYVDTSSEGLLYLIKEFNLPFDNYLVSRIISINKLDLTEALLKYYTQIPDTDRISLLTHTIKTKISTNVVKLFIPSPDVFKDVVYNDLIKELILALVHPYNSDFFLLYNDNNLLSILQIIVDAVSIHNTIDINIYQEFYDILLKYTFIEDDDYKYIQTISYLESFGINVQ